MPTGHCRFHDVPVPVLGSDVAERRLEKVLADRGLRIHALDSAQEVLSLPPRAYPCIVELEESPAPGRESPLRALRRLALDRPGLRLIAVHFDASARQIAADLTSIHPSWHIPVLVWPRDADRLEREIISLRFGVWTERVESDVSRTWRVHHLVRAGVRWILRFDPTSAERLAHGPSDWALKVIADGVGCSPKVLSTAAHAADLDLKQVAETWVGLKVLVGHELDEKGWHELALAVGYEGLPGLSQLMARVFGMRLRALAGGGIERALVDFERILAPVLPNDVLS